MQNGNIFRGLLKDKYFLGMPDSPYIFCRSKRMYQEKNESTPNWVMTRKCHNHVPQTNPEDHKEKTQNTDSHMTAST